MSEDIQDWLKKKTPLQHDDITTINIVEKYLKHENTILSELENDDIIWIMRLRMQYGFTGCVTNN